MKWIFALNERSPGFRDYANHVHVAVASARRHCPHLDPVCIFDGQDCGLTRWLRARGVTVVFRRSPLVDSIPSMPLIARGAYLRLEIPAVAAEFGWTDSHVLYTDCDVFFRGDVAPLLGSCAPRFLAAAPETDRGDRARFNSGVLWLNLAAFRAELPGLVETVHRLLPATMRSPFDQLALQDHFRGRVDPLPDELNWKPYWGYNVGARIVHFHGPKPGTGKYTVLNGVERESITRLASPAYFTWALEWDRELAEALTQHPVEREFADEPVELGFDGFTAQEGLGPVEGPFPQWYLPEIHWGLAPRTRVAFAAPTAGRWRVSCDYLCPYPDQSFEVNIDGCPLGSRAVLQVSLPRTALFECDLAAGEHVLEFVYARGFPRHEDPRPLALMFRALRVEAVS